MPARPTVPAGSPFPLGNLPFGVGRRRDGSRGGFVAIGDAALDLDRAAAAGLFGGTAIAGGGVLDRAGTLTELIAAGRAAVAAVRDRAAELLGDAAGHAHVAPFLVERSALAMELPVTIGDYVDFYSSLHHATNLGRMFRPDGEPLLPNWRRIPVGYHGRTGTIVTSGTGIPRPSGMRLVNGTPHPGPSEALDIELEVGAIVGRPSRWGTPVAATDAEDHLAGLCLLNDWSARDIQAYEYQPLGPFLGKSFATSLSPWIVTLDALAPHRVAPPRQDPPPADHLRAPGATAFDLELEVLLQSAAMRARHLQPVVISRTCFADMYWTPAQQLAHLTSNGSHVRAGDLLGSGTVSGPAPGSEGSLIELTRRGERPIELPDGTTRSFLADGDRVVLRGWAGHDPETRIGLGSVSGTISPAGTAPPDGAIGVEPRAGQG